MSDYGLLDTVREVLKNDEIIKDMNLQQRIYLTLPPKPLYPCILMEVDEVWSDYTVGENQAIARMNFHLNLMSHMHLGRKAIELGLRIEHLVDGRSMRLSPIYIANFRKTSSVIDMPMRRSPRVIQQFYQAIVWKRAASEEMED